MTLLLTPVDVFKCLADETRARITLLIVGEGELCVCELTSALEQSQPKISRHLALLRATGLLMDRRKGQWVYYRLHPELPAWVTDLLRTVAAANQDWLDIDARRLCTMNIAALDRGLCD
jgi:ArsR family transcriptional regulator